MPQAFTKDPDANLEYRVDWSEWLGDDDTITNSQWIVPEGMTLEYDVYTTTATMAKLSGGVVETKYRVTNRITTAEGRVDDRSIFLTIKER